MSKQPEIKDIERLLGQIQPEPGEGLQERMQSAPWNQPDTVTEIRKSRYQAPLRAAAAFVVMMFLLAMLFSTPVRTVAGQFISLFFTVGESNTRDISYVIPEPTATIPAEIIQATQQALRPSIATLQASAAIEIKTPSYLPDGYEYLSGYTDDAGNVYLSYKFQAGDRIVRFLNIRQIDDEPHGMEVGSEAMIQPVEINGVMGEYLQGSWVTEDSTRTADTVDMTLDWDNDVELHTMSWYEGGVLYEIFYQSSLFYYVDGGLVDEAGYLTLDDLIDIAENLE